MARLRVKAAGQARPAELAAAIRRQIPAVQVIPTALNQQAATRGTEGGLPLDIIDIAGVDVMDTRCQRLPASPGERGRRSRGHIHHLEVRMEGGEVQRYIRAQISDKPGTELLHFFLRVVRAEDQERGHLEPNLRLVLEPAQGIQDRLQPGQAKLLVELVSEGFEVNIGRVHMGEEFRAGLGRDVAR